MPHQPGQAPPETLVASFIASLTRALLLHAAAVTAAVALALSLSGPPYLRVVPPSSASPSPQASALGLLAAAFFSQGLLLAWRALAAEAPLTGASLAAQLRRVAREDAWLGRGLGLGAPLPAGDGGVGNGIGGDIVAPTTRQQPLIGGDGGVGGDTAPPAGLHLARPSSQRLVYMVSSCAGTLRCFRSPVYSPIHPSTHPRINPSTHPCTHTLSPRPCTMGCSCRALTSQRRPCGKNLQRARCLPPFRAGLKLHGFGLRRSCVGVFARAAAAAAAAPLVVAPAHAPPAAAAPTPPARAFHATPSASFALPAPVYCSSAVAPRRKGSGRLQQLAPG